MTVIRPGDAPVYHGARAIRVAPSKLGKPAAGFWKFWVQKDDIYLASRSGGHLNKISIHASGQIHMHLGPRNIQQFAQPIALDNGSWFHMLEIRFLLRADADLPPSHLSQLKKKDQALLLEVPDERVLYLNLIVSSSNGSHLRLPNAFYGAFEIWRTSLANRRTALLLGRIMPFDEQCAAELHHIRDELQPHINLFGSTPPDIPYMEVLHPYWSNKGNVLMVIPMGSEGRRFDKVLSNHVTDASVDTRSILVQCPNATAPLFAPDASEIGSISIRGETGRVTLAKGHEVIHKLGIVTLAIDAQAIRWGESFTRPRYTLPCPPTIGGAMPRRWEYGYDLSFDGSNILFSIAELSMALRNKNLKLAISELTATEEILMHAPKAAIQLTTSKESLTASADLTCSFRLRDI